MPPPSGISADAVARDTSSLWLEQFLHLGENPGVIAPDNTAFCPRLPESVEPAAGGDDSRRSMTCLSPATHLRYRPYEQQ